MTNCENNIRSSGVSFCRDGFTEVLHLEMSVGNLVSCGSPHATSNKAKQNMAINLMAESLFLFGSIVIQNYQSIANIITSHGSGRIDIGSWIH